MGKTSGHRAQVRLNMLFYRDKDEWEYVTMLEKLIRDYKDGRARRSSILFYCGLDTLYDGLRFLSWSAIWREAMIYEVKYHIEDDNMYFIWCHNRKCFVI